MIRKMTEEKEDKREDRREGNKDGKEGIKEKKEKESKKRSSNEWEKRKYMITKMTRRIKTIKEREVEKESRSVRKEIR